MFNSAWGELFATEVKAFVSQQVGPIVSRLEALEKRAPEPGPPGPPGKPGINGEPGARGNDGAPGRDGLSVDIAEVEAIITEALGKIPPAKDGAPGAKGERGERGERGPPGLPGEQGIAGRDGLPGRDGLAGKDGQDAIDFAKVNEFYEDDGRILVRQWLSPSGEIKREFRHVTAAPIYRGTWQPRQYLKGDQVTVNGSQYIALQDTEHRPAGGPESGWQLTAKRGRDGKPHE